VKKVRKVVFAGIGLAGKFFLLMWIAGFPGVSSSGVHLDRFFFNVVIVAPVVEEWFFRGFLMWFLFEFLGGEWISEPVLGDWNWKDVVLFFWNPWSKTEIRAQLGFWRWALIILLQGAIFTSVHLDWLEWIALLALRGFDGILFGIVVVQTRSTVPAMVGHGVWNFLCCILFDFEFE
jgi:membrane protease YdiL (CAAX protease family)